MVSVRLTLFIETVLDNNASHTIDKVGDIVTHIISHKGVTIFIPLIDDEDILGEETALYLTELGMLYLLPFLVPDHPAAEMAKSLPRN